MRLYQAVEPLQRAIVVLNRGDLDYLLDLPEGLRVVAVAGEFDPPSIRIAVEGPSLAPVADGARSPVLGGGTLRREHLVHDGKVWTRWEWVPE